MPVVVLPERSVIRVSGEDALTFLNGLVTNDVSMIEKDRACFAALLTPQGKILFDFIVIEAPEGGFYLDVAQGLAADLVKRLTFYKLRAKVLIENLSDSLGVAVVWGESRHPEGASFPDPRAEGLGLRIIALRNPLEAASDTSVETWHARRIAHGVPEGGRDFVYGDTFPHEANMDRLHGLDFKKGCYVGQEVVSRMEHRGTARTRIVRLRFEGTAPQEGAEISARERVIGRMGSSDAASGTGLGLGLVRVDRVEEALAEGIEVKAGQVPVTVILPSG